MEWFGLKGTLKNPKDHLIPTPCTRPGCSEPSRGFVLLYLFNAHKNVWGTRSKEPWMLSTPLLDSVYQQAA